jgi:hypothetical protein
MDSRQEPAALREQTAGYVEAVPHCLSSDGSMSRSGSRRNFNDFPREVMLPLTTRRLCDLPSPVFEAIVSALLSQDLAWTGEPAAAYLFLRSCVHFSSCPSQHPLPIALPCKEDWRRRWSHRSQDAQQLGLWPEQTIDEPPTPQTEVT